MQRKVRLSRHPRRFTRHTPAGEVVIGYLNAQAARLGSLDMAVRRDEPDAVHQMRVTVRRLRSTLQSFTAVVSGPDTKELRGELKWLVHAHLAGENGFSFGLLHERAHH